LSSGAQVVVGALWSVFDKDCNAITKWISENWFDENGLLDVTQKGDGLKFSELKEICENMLNGVAFVKYGNLVVC
jgi:hypothetical protein